MIKKIEIDQVACIGCGTCWVGQPQLFCETHVNGELRAAATGTINMDDARLRIIAESCPTLAILLLDEQGQLVFPTAEQRAARDHAADW